ncbi:MAG: MarR family winged helix-turn-helix transcriptional regulator [Microthrixaceae bacterium]
MSSRPLSPADYRTLAQFRYALRVFQRFSEDAARSAGVTPSQHQLMLAIKGWGGSEDPAVGDLAEVLQLKHHSAVELVQRAAQADLVIASTDPDDARRQLITLTEKGEEILASLSLTHRDELRRFRSEMADILDELG